MGFRLPVKIFRCFSTSLWKNRKIVPEESFRHNPYSNKILQEKTRWSFSSSVSR